jgi:hypothetical protein
MVIGVNRYGDPIPSLSGAVRDAVLMRNWLLDHGGVDKDHLFLLLSPNQAGAPVETERAGDDPLLPEYADGYFPATHAMIRKKMERLYQRSEGRKAERLYFYYSGHGVRKRVGINKYDDAILPEDVSNILSDYSISLDSLLASFGAFDFANQFFFVDACRTRVDDDFQFGHAWHPQDAKPEAVSTRTNQQFRFYATSPDVAAKELESAGQARGAFTDALLKGLRGEKKVYDYDKKKYVVRVDSLFEQVSTAIEARNEELTEKGAKELIQLPRQSVHERGAPGQDPNPILARFEVESTAPQLLWDAYSTLRVEVKRIESFIDSPETGSDFGEYLETIGSRFNPYLSDLRSTLSHTGLGVLRRSTRAPVARPCKRSPGCHRCLLCPRKSSRRFREGARSSRQALVRQACGAPGQ